MKDAVVSSVQPSSLPASHHANTLRPHHPKPLQESPSLSYIPSLTLTGLVNLRVARTPPDSVGPLAAASAAAAAAAAAIAASFSAALLFLSLCEPLGVLPRDSTALHWCTTTLPVISPCCVQHQAC